MAVARGPKPTAVLARCGLRPVISAREPFTTAELIDAMRPVDLSDKNVALLHYGEPNLSLSESLTHRGALLRELLLNNGQAITLSKDFCGRVGFRSGFEFLPGFGADNEFGLYRKVNTHSFLIPLLRYLRKGGDSSPPKP
ncbi:MAG TPA: hypothetical protein VE715_03590, partial [Blastocatellia bacterium]|nr:hypothetical protein [Blastocatellia bacterium]